MKTEIFIFLHKFLSFLLSLTIISAVTAINAIGATTIPPHPKSHEFSSCSHVFIDLGANIGVQARRLYEGEKFPLKGELNRLFNQYFGDNQHHDVCTFAFEPNPRHTPRLKEMEARYQSLGIRYYFFPYAVSTIDTQFQLSKPNSDTQMGSTLLKSSSTASSVTVNVINFLNFFTKYILNNKNIKNILCKMDIEGEEYNLLPALITSGMICSIDTIAIEYHLRRSSTFQDGFLKKFTRIQIIDFQSNITSYIQKYSPVQGLCKTKIIKLDDELYHNDNLMTNPLPLYPNAPKECHDPKQMCILSEPIDGMTLQQYKETIYGVKRWA